MLPPETYETIGRFVIYSLLFLGGVGGVVSLLIILLILWSRGLTALSNRMWHGYEPTDSPPPLWKLRISGVATALAKFRFRKAPAAYREAADLAEDDMNAGEAIRELARSLLNDEEMR